MVLESLSEIDSYQSMILLPLRITWRVSGVLKLEASIQMVKSMRWQMLPKNTLPDWEQVLSSAAHLQRLLPDAVLVGGTASAVYARLIFLG